MSDYLSNLVEQNNRRMREDKDIGFWIETFRGMDKAALQEEENKYANERDVLTKKKKSFFGLDSLFGFATLIACCAAVYAFLNMSHFNNGSFVLIILAGVVMLVLYSKHENTRVQTQEGTGKVLLAARLVQQERGDRDFI